MFGGDDGVLPSGVALASDDSFAPMVQLRRAAVQLLNDFYAVQTPWLTIGEPTALAPVTH
jgi:hypothetical protein